MTLFRCPISLLILILNTSSICSFKLMVLCIFKLLESNNFFFISIKKWFPENINIGMKFIFESLSLFADKQLSILG